MKTNMSTEAETRTPSKRAITLHFRWEILQTDSNTAELIIPVGEAAVLDGMFINAMKLSDAEIMRAEELVLRSIAIVQ